MSPVEPRVNQDASENVYQTIGDSPPEYPIQPPPETAAVSTGLPPWVWVMVGVLLANVLNKVVRFMHSKCTSITDIALH